MAQAAIGIHAALGFRGAVVAPVGIGLVLVVMVAEMLGCSAGLVLAVGADRCPAELQRHEHQEED